jgi:hypothetical protein
VTKFNETGCKKVRNIFEEFMQCSTKINFHIFHETTGERVRAAKGGRKLAKIVNLSSRRCVPLPCMPLFMFSLLHSSVFFSVWHFNLSYNTFSLSLLTFMSSLLLKFIDIRASYAIFMLHSLSLLFKFYNIISKSTRSW